MNTYLVVHTCVLSSRILLDIYREPSSFVRFCMYINIHIQYAPWWWRFKVMNLAALPVFTLEKEAVVKEVQVRETPTNQTNHWLAGAQAGRTNGWMGGSSLFPQ